MEKRDMLEIHRLFFTLVCWLVQIHLKISIVDFDITK